MGGLILVGTNRQVLEPGNLQFFSAVAARLGAHIHHMRSQERVSELKSLDPLTGLPHRLNFLARLDRLISLLAVQGERMRLRLLCISGLGRYSLTHDLEDTMILLRKISSHFLHFTNDYWELGHISYGLFAIAVPENQAEELEKCTSLLKKSLNEWPTIGRLPGKKNFIFHEKDVFCPDDGDKPERLLGTALAQLAEAPS
jgi:GGDEF domain-containing protein